MKIKQVKLGPFWDNYLDYMDRQAFPGLPTYPKQGALWWIAEKEEGMPVAFAGLKVVDKITGFLCRVGVEKDYRGQGLQKRLIRVREAKAKKLGLKWLITYVHPANLASANSLVACGMRLYSPQNPYGVAGALYFRKAL
jgi:GNAT superfamily N-acetyltransferase